MSIQIDGTALVAVRPIVTLAGEPVSAATQVEIPLAELLSVPGTVPAASETVAGVVKMTAAVPNQAALTVTGADAATVATSATTAVTALVTKVNALLAAMRAAGITVP